jgi:2-polyprenyl-3-methyl-5-hydroxy-6-metoxy-1,4-benzoquinol methylase
VSLIERVATKESAIIDVGGGESTLVDDLLSHGYNNITVLDISRRAIDENIRRLGIASERAHWLIADITKAELTQSTYDVWHDRAVFHFLSRKLTG